MTDDWRDAWESELDRLELDVDRAEALLNAAEPEPLPAWSPPELRLPLPEDLVPRARLVLERQLAVAHQLAQRAVSTQRHRALTSRIRGNTPPDIPVYVDVTA